MRSVLEDNPDVANRSCGFQDGDPSRQTGFSGEGGVTGIIPRLLVSSQMKGTVRRRIAGTEYPAYFPEKFHGLEHVLENLIRHYAVKLVVLEREGSSRVKMSALEFRRGPGESIQPM